MSDIEQTAQQRLAADEAALRRTKKQVTLGGTFRAFWRYPSPWMITAALVLTLAARVVAGDWRLGDLWGPVVLVALFPVLEWVVHVFVLHWRPRAVAGVTLDTLLARKHREHHADPRDVPLVFIPWQALSFMLAVAVLGLAYEWTHYLVHSDYKPRTVAYKAVWRNHRLHHYKNEHYWFTVTTTSTADRLFGTYPDPASVETSPTAKDLHGGGAQLTRSAE